MAALGEIPSDAATSCTGRSSSRHAATTANRRAATRCGRLLRARSSSTVTPLRWHTLSSSSPKSPCQLAGARCCSGKKISHVGRRGAARPSTGEPTSRGSPVARRTRCLSAPRLLPLSSGSLGCAARLHTRRWNAARPASPASRPHKASPCSTASQGGAWAGSRYARWLVQQDSSADETTLARTGLLALLTESWFDQRRGCERRMVTKCGAGRGSPKGDASRLRGIQGKRSAAVLWGPWTLLARKAEGPSGQRAGQAVGPTGCNVSHPRHGPSLSTRPNSGAGAPDCCGDRPKVSSCCHVHADGTLAEPSRAPVPTSRARRPACATTSRADWPRTAPTPGSATPRRSISRSRPASTSCATGARAASAS